MFDLKISQAGIDLIKSFESFSAIPYRCPADKLTIGYGHVILPSESFTSITEQEAEQLLRSDVAITENCINHAVAVPITQNEFDALVSLTFNIGTNAFTNSTLLKYLNSRLYAAASQQFLRWNKVNGVVLSGLTRRRKSEMSLFLQ